MGYNVLLAYPLCQTIIHELIGGVLTPIFCYQHPNILSCLVLHRSLELLEPGKSLLLVLKEIGLGFPGIIINEGYAIILTFK